MPLFLESFEDLELIYTKLNPMMGDEEDVLDDLRATSEELHSLRCELRRCGALTAECGKEAARYSGELVELGHELGLRVKYDEQLAIFRDEFAWYGSCVAALAAELDEYSAELALYGDAASRCGDELDALWRLVVECSADPHDECDHQGGEYCDQYGYEDHW